MNLCEQAEELRLSLIMGLVSQDEVIRWADRLIEQEANPPEWLLDVSLAANDGRFEIERRLTHLPCEGNRTLAARHAMERFSRAFRANAVDVAAATGMLVHWAASAVIDQEDWTKAMTPRWIADDSTYGAFSEADVVEAIGECLRHVLFASRPE